MAAVSKDPARHLLVVGVNQRSARAALRDRLLTGEPDQAEFLARVRGAGVREAIVVSTCERFELLVVVDDPASAKRWRSASTPWRRKPCGTNSAAANPA